MSTANLDMADQHKTKAKASAPADNHELWLERTENEFTREQLGKLAVIGRTVPGALKLTATLSSQLALVKCFCRLDEMMAKVEEENRILREAVHPRPETKGTAPLILYFGTAADRTEFVEAYQEVHPNAKSYNV